MKADWNTSGSKVRRSNANSVMTCNKPQKSRSVVRCQLSRFRLLPTTQAMNTLRMRDRNATDVREVQHLNACEPRDVTVWGSVMELRPVQPVNAPAPIWVKFSLSVREVSPLQYWNAQLSTRVQVLGISSAVSCLHPWNADMPMDFNCRGSVREARPVQYRKA